MEKTLSRYGKSTLHNGTVLLIPVLLSQLILLQAGVVVRSSSSI